MTQDRDGDGPDVVCADTESAVHDGVGFPAEGEALAGAGTGTGAPSREYT